jgi:hypothetical protein
MCEWDSAGMRIEYKNTRNRVFLYEERKESKIFFIIVRNSIYSIDE